MSNTMQALPTYSQWKNWQRFVDTLRIANVCMHCRTVIALFHDNLIRVGCRVKIWDEQVTDTPDGEVVKLTSKIVPMNMTGPGCPTCQYIMTKLESDELTRYDKECREWQELHKPQVSAMDIRILYGGHFYHLIKGCMSGTRWQTDYGVKVPTVMEAELFKQYAVTCDEHIVAGLEPWMRALGMTAPPYTPQSESQIRTPSKRQVYIDVTESVLDMPRAKRREDDILK